MKPMLVLGIMSGTSIDGVDYALCEVARDSVRLIRHWSRAFPKTLQRRLHAAAANKCGAHELAQLHHDLGRLYAKQAAPLLKWGSPSRLPPSDSRLGCQSDDDFRSDTAGGTPAGRNAAGTAAPRCELVGLHGQTIFHNPERRVPATLQIGEPAYLAEALRVPVVSNFRAADLAAGGQGAPLATLFHKIVFARRGQHVCVNNLGGISNGTSLDWRTGREPRLAAFDTGPANVLMDLAMREFTAGKMSHDRNGSWARRGSPHEPLLARWLRHPFFRQPPPKSTGRELFGEYFWRKEQRQMRAARLSQFDVLATLTEFTARSLALNYQFHLPSPPQSVVLCGGGARNPVLVSRIRASLQKHNPAVCVSVSEDSGWPSQAIEPAAFALLTYYRWRRWPANLPSTTGAAHAVLLGQLTEP